MSNDVNDLLFTCPDCNGFGEREAFNFFLDTTELRDCPTCRGEGTVDHDPAEESGDEEPADLDSDAGYDPYTGGAEDDGYDTYGDDCGDY